MIQEPISRKNHQERFCREIGRKEVRKLRGRRQKCSPVLCGLGIFGVVGWSVAVPTLLGVALGLWLDAHLKAPFSWTLTLLLVGLALGCLNAWYWVSRERKIIEEDRKCE